MSLAISDFPIKFMSAFEDRHYLSKMVEGKSHCLVTYVLRKINSNEDRSLSISEKLNSFAETQFYFGIAKTALNLCTLKFLLRSF